MGAARKICHAKYTQYERTAQHPNQNDSCASLPAEAISENTRQQDRHSPEEWEQRAKGGIRRIRLNHVYNLWVQTCGICRPTDRGTSYQLSSTVSLPIYAKLALLSQFDTRRLKANLQPSFGFGHVD